MRVKSQKSKVKSVASLSLVTCHLSLARGFTLLEIIIATSIVAVIGVIISQALSATTKSNTKVEILKEVKQNGDFALSIMERMIRNAKAITSTCSDTGSAGPSVTLKNVDGGSTTLTCQLDGAISRIASVSAAGTDYLSGTSVTLGGADCSSASLLFTCTSLAGVANTIAIGFRLGQKGMSPSIFDVASQSFQTSVSIRNH
ncbi:prepilin-type N-terminal cleavage/methylation domain-containing protein [Candidatus Gottesmanbacteria bacterium]|nr:prepilin-type N-terminal cleavage/methylation domain-containing protein [Candidatus Gottesmanbacteria bacterium]